MRLISLVSLVVGVFLFQAGAVHACESYEEFSTDELKEFREMLNNAEADPLDRMFALEKMACSDRPNIRHYAMKQGLEVIDEPLVRNEIMLMAMMQKSRIDVVLGLQKGLTADDKKFIARNGEVYSQKVVFRSESSGCLSLYSGDKCSTDYSIIISGDKVEFNYQPVHGVFRLSRGGELVGTLRAVNSDKYTRIPAVIKLF